MGEMFLNFFNKMMHFNNFIFFIDGGTPKRRGALSAGLISSTNLFHYTRWYTITQVTNK